MRSILKQVMEIKGENSISLGEKSGVPQPTISRFLSGEHEDMRSATLKKLSPFLGVSESQLRGDLPIDWDLLKTSSNLTPVSFTPPPIIDERLTISLSDCSVEKVEVIQRIVAEIKKMKDEELPSAEDGFKAATRALISERRKKPRSERKRGTNK